MSKVPNRKSEETLSVKSIHRLSKTKAEGMENNQDSPLSKEAVKLYRAEDKAKIESVIKKFSDQKLTRKNKGSKQQRIYAFLGVFALILIAVLTAVFIF